MIRIDAHQHFWRLDRGDYGWLTPDLAPIYRDFEPGDLAPELANAGMDRTILIQAAPTLAETRFMLEIAARTPFVAGVVGWVDFSAPDAAETITALATNPLLVGLRPMIHDIDDPEWMLLPALAPAFAALQRLGLVFDALVKPQHLAPLLTLAQCHPGLPIVIDHGAKPMISLGLLDPWRKEMSALAALPNLSCKLSGLATEAGPEWSVERLRPYTDHLIATFGPDRLIFGSDWPVCTLAVSYQAWIEVAEALTGKLTVSEGAAIFGGNAERIYLTKRGRK